jgi:hypothetical protein
MVICTICGAISTDDEMDEIHYNATHADKDEPEDEFWIRFAESFTAMEYADR